MGLFKSKEEKAAERERKAEEEREIRARVENSDGYRAFEAEVKELLSIGGALYEWLAVSDDHACKLHVLKDGIIFELMNFSRRFYKENGTYTADKLAYSFGKSGFADLPNSQYITAFDDCLKDFLEKECPIRWTAGRYEAMFQFNESYKKGW